MSAIFKSKFQNKIVCFYVENKEAINEESFVKESQCISNSGSEVSLFKDRVTLKFVPNNDVQLEFFVDDIRLFWGGVSYLTYQQAVQILNYIENNSVNTFLKLYKKSLLEYITHLELIIKSFSTVKSLSNYSESILTNDISNLSDATRILHQLSLY